MSSPVHKKYITALINIFSDKGRGHLLNFLERHILESRTIVSANTGLYTDVKFVVFIFQLCRVVPLRGGGQNVELVTFIDHMTVMI